MKNPEQFVKSVDTLVDAYEKGNLKHMSPCNCAVGNLIAYSQGTYRFERKTGGDRSTWVYLLEAIRTRLLVNATKEELARYQYFRKNIEGKSSVDMETCYRQIESTGYTANEIERIEAAFEKNQVRECGIAYTSRGSSEYDDPLEGLLKAIEVLGNIHEIPEETLTCMKEKIQTKTYTKSFELNAPSDSPIDIEDMSSDDYRAYRSLADD